MSARVREPDDNDPLNGEPSSDGLLKEGPLNYAPKRARRPDPRPDLNDAPKTADAAPSPQTPEPPWKQKKQRQAFAGDAAAAELRSRLTLVPDRIPEPLPASTVSILGFVGRFMGVISVAAAAAGVAGYLWGSAPSAKRPRLAAGSGQVEMPPKLSATDLKVSNLDSRTPMERPAAPADMRGAPTGAISVGAAQRPAPAAMDSPPTSPPATFRPEKSSPQGDDAADIALKMKNGEELMANGDIAAARMLFERVAEAGEAAAAFALAETYDPLVLKKLGTRGGITYDVPLAQRWYARARDLGSTAASERIVRLTRPPG